MSKITDYSDLGYLILQDHQVAEGRVTIGRRKMIVGGRLVKEHDPTLQDSPGSHWAEIGRDLDKGTLGDIHPWLFWQTAARGKREMGAWQSCFAAITSGGSATGGGPTTGGRGGGESSLMPVRNADWQADERFVGKSAFYGKGMPKPPRGVMSIALPGTSERKQFELMGNLDPRLFAPHISGPGECGSLVVDLQPDAEPCMSRVTVPGGVGSRAARLQSLVRVIPTQVGGDDLTGGQFNMLALNYTYAGVDYAPGYGAIFGKMVDSAAPSGPITPGGAVGGGGSPPGPITPGGSSTNAAFLLGALDTAVPVGLDPDVGPGGDNVGKGPHEYGRFSRSPKPGNGVALMDAFDAGGIVHCGASGDKHQIGRDADGNPINSAHISVGANFFRNPEFDGPLLFEGLYPDPPPMPLISRVHLTWDGKTDHQWRGGTKAGVWRWYCEVPYLAPTTGEPPQKPTPTPALPPGPGGPRPGGPTTPGPGGPTAPPPAGPRAPAPTTGGGGTSGGGGITAPPPWPLQPPITPNPGGTRFPGYPETGGPPAPPGGPTTPGGGGGNPPPNPPSPNLPPPGGGAPGGANPNPGPFGPPKTGPKKVGGGSKEDPPKKTVYHPFAEGWGGTEWRPQKWEVGATNFLHSIGSVQMGEVLEDDKRRPTVMCETPWGGQSEDCWSYTESPSQSAVHGGVANGGLLMHPPSLTMEDYLALNSSRSVNTPGSVAHVTLAPGVYLAFGTPHRDGGVAGTSYRFRQEPTSRAVIFEASDVSRNWTTLSQSESSTTTGEVSTSFYGTTIRVPVGDDGNRPGSLAGGELRSNNNDATIERLEWGDSLAHQWRTAVDGPTVPVGGLCVLAEAAGSPGISWQELGTTAGSDAALVEFGGELRWQKIARANLSIKVPATLANEAGNPVRTICTSSTAEATFTTLTIPASTITAAGDHCILEWWGEMLNNSGANNVFTMRIKVGGTTYYQQSMTLPPSATRRAFSGRMVLAYRGANLQRLQGQVWVSGPTAATVGIGDFGAAGTAAGGAIFGEPTATTSGALAFLVSLQSDVSNASINAKLFGATLISVPAA